MAAPLEMTVENLSGVFQLNTSLSDHLEEFFKLQGLSWIARKGLQAVKLYIEQYVKGGKVYIDTKSVAGNFRTTEERRILDWTVQDHFNPIFGNIQGRATLSLKEELKFFHDGADGENSFLLGDRLGDGTNSELLGPRFIQSWEQNVDKGFGWHVEQVWGFEVINGQRYHTRRLKCSREGKSELLRLVYDYKGPIVAQ